MHKIITTICLYSIISISYAMPIGNLIEGVGPSKNRIYPVFCLQKADKSVGYQLAHGARVDGNQYSGNKYYVGGTLRFGGCKENNTYLGYLGIDTNSQGYRVSVYEAPDAPIALVNPTVDAAGNILGNIRYTPIPTNTTLLSEEPSKNPTWEFVGINLSGLEFGKVIDPATIPDLSEEHATSSNSDLTTTKTFIAAGMNTIRLPISWGYLQLEGAGKGDINLDYFNSYIKPTLESLTRAHVNVILDLHAYMRYSEFGKQYSGCGAEGPCPDGTLITDANALEDVWIKLYRLIKEDKQIDQSYLLLDLMNEPVDVPGDLVFTIQSQVIKALRQQGFQGYILVEGNAWTGLHAWASKTWTDTNGKTYSNATLFTRENFNKSGVTDLSHILINVHQYLDNDFSGTHDTCVNTLSTTGENGYNLDVFIEYLKTNQLKAIVTEFGSGLDSISCAPALDSFVKYLADHSAKNNTFGFVGWTIWSSGHGWGDYNLRVKPTSYHMDVLKHYLQP